MRAKFTASQAAPVKRQRSASSPGWKGSPETGARLSVEDDRPGVAEADLPRLTDRFYCGESSRTTPGNGLGLSVVSAVAELHGATLDMNAMKPGLRVTLSFPAASRRT